MSEGIADRRHDADYGVKRGNHVGDHLPDTAAQSCRGILAAQEKREDRAKESVRQAKGHHQYHNDGGSNGDAAHDPGTSRVGSKFGFKKLPEPRGGFVQHGRRDRGKRLSLG